MGFILELSPAANRDLKKLPNNVQKEILFTHLPAIQDDPYGVGVPLRGALKGERCYHFGRKSEYRIVYLIEEELITVTILGTRESIYKRARRHHRK
jgi:mRNA-degrading endonuclease RelE of RelBE toxin-antitoxin system